MMTPDGIEATLVEIDRVLTEGGFSEVSRPLTVSGIPFEVLRAYAAEPGFLDLVVVIDATEGTKHQLQRGYWLIERIARALDQAKSRRSLTAVVLHDADAARVPTEDFLRLGRILLVTDAGKVRHELAPILPILLEASGEASGDPLEDLLLAATDGHDESRVALIQSARLGSDHVQDTLVDWLDRSFVQEGNDDGDSQA
jgi:hypothetical protein